MLNIKGQKFIYRCFGRVYQLKRNCFPKAAVQYTRLKVSNLCHDFFHNNTSPIGSTVRKFMIFCLLLSDTSPLTSFSQHG